MLSFIPPKSLSPKQYQIHYIFAFSSVGRPLISVNTSLLSLVAQNILNIEYKKHPLLELTFDNNNRQKCLDLRPLLPMILRY